MPASLSGGGGRPSDWGLLGATSDPVPEDPDGTDTPPAAP